LCILFYCFDAASGALGQFGNCLVRDVDTSYNGTDCLCKLPGASPLAKGWGPAVRIPFLQLFWTIRPVQLVHFIVFFQQGICLSCQQQILLVRSLNSLLFASNELGQFDNCITTVADTSYNGTDYVCKLLGMESTCKRVGAAAKILFLRLF